MVVERREQFRIEGQSFFYQFPGDGAVVRPLDDLRASLWILASLARVRKPEEEPALPVRAF
jgi:hypothetical protein